jgi:hypothetical protein
MKKKTIKKKMTMDDLAVVVGKGFSDIRKEVDGKIDNLAIMVGHGFFDMKKEMDKRFEAAEQNLEQFKNTTNSKFEVIGQRFNDMEDHFDGVENRLTNIEKLFTKNEDEHKVFRTKINVLEKRA